MRNRRSVCPYTFHNRYVLYVAQLLGLVTLIRSVTEPFGLQDDNNLLARTVRIADKVNQLGANGRVVPLGETGTQQLECYNRHLASLYEYLRFHRPDLAASVTSALNGSSSLLFYIDDDLCTRPLRPKWMLEQLKATWPFPTNWPRHSLSGWIRRKDLSKGAIRALYGHSDFGTTPQSKFDATALTELSSIASEIDDYLLKHNIRSIEGWNTPI